MATAETVAMRIHEIDLTKTNEYIVLLVSDTDTLLVYRIVDYRCYLIGLGTDAPFSGRGGNCDS